MASTIAAGFESKGNLLPDAEMAPVIRQRGAVNVYIGTKRTFRKTETFLDIPMHDNSSGSIHITYAAIKDLREKVCDAAPLRHAARQLYGLDG